ncbi:unnamed protein product [Trypanosoma congolense IL3000]|uniref:WGS project CAEQ00000000 data, annotated contig 548 n=1 Tax=Trypanosoma congolense (strain IL3000) TaxID=1068625 RepID=F9WGT9_TRYCI|nr:unnamed protein product [Trypanosoma congolense IL3000]
MHAYSFNLPISHPPPCLRVAWGNARCLLVPLLPTIPPPLFLIDTFAAVEVCGEQWAQEIHQRNMSLPSSAPPPEFLAKHDLDINGLQKVLQQIDESFNMSDDNVDRKLRLQHLERQQAALERLYGETFRRQESPTGFRPMGGTSVPLTAEGAAGGDVVLTPRPTDASATPCHAYTGTTGVAQEAGPYPCSSDTLPPGPSPMLSPSQVTSYPHVGEGETARTTVQPTVKGLAGCGISSPQRSSLRSPEPLPTRYEDAAIRHDHDLVESFLGGVEVKEGHPYVVGGGTGSRGSPGMAGQPWSGYRSLRNPQFRGLMAPRATSVTDRIAAPEHFDVAEDEKLLKILLEKSLGRARRNARKVSESRSNSHNEGVSSKPPPPPSPSRKCESTGRGGGNTFQRVSDANAPQELPKENYVWGKDAEVGNKVVRELTQKTECLARHLVKSLRDRTQLQCRVDRLEGMLDVANTEVGRLRRSLEQKGDGTLAESAWRATINAKERELRICEDEIRRLRILMEQQIARQGGASAKHGSGAALEQAKSDLEYMTHELGVAHMRQREAEAQLERTKRALGAAESHIQMLDKRLARAERATALARLQDIRSGLETSSGDAPGMLALGALEVSNSAATLETLKQREAIEEWPPAAKRELARLSAQVEGLLLKHEESDRHAELRLSNSNKENETLRRQCDELKREIMTYESHIENLRKESIESGLREGQLRQQLLDLREDAVLLSDLLQATIKSAKEMQQAFTADSLRNVQSRVVTERFVSNVLCDLDTFGRFFSALQRMEVIEPQLGQQSKERMPVSEAIMTRRDFVLRAIDDAMSRPLDKFQSDTRPVPAQHMVRTEKTASAQHTDRTEKTASAQHTDRTEKTSSAQHTDRTEKPAPAQHTDRTEKTAPAHHTDHSGKTSSAQRTDHSGKTSSAQRTDHSEKAVPTESAGRNEKPVVQPAAQPGALEEASDGGLNVSTWSYVHDKIPVISPLPSPPFSVAQWEGYHSTVLEDAAVPCRDQQPRGKEIPHLPSSSERSRDVHGADHLGSVESFSPSLTNTGTEPRIALVPAISWPEPRGDEKGRAHPRQMAKHRVVSTTVHSSESYISGTPSSQFKLSDSNSVAVLHNRMKDIVPHLQQQPSHSQESQGYLTELEEEPTEGASDERSLGPVLTTLAIPNNNAAVPNARALLKKLNSREDNGAVLRGRALLMDATGREKASDDVIVGGRDAGKRGAVGETTDMRGRQSSGAGGASRNTPVHGFHPPHASIIEPEERSGRLSRAAERSTLANAVTPPPATQEGKTLQANWRPASLPTPDPAPLLRPRTSRGGRIEVAAVLAEPHHPGSGGPTVAAETGVRSSGHNAVRSAGTVTKSQGAADKTEDGRRHRVSAGMEFPSLRHPTLASGKQEAS